MTDPYGQQPFGQQPGGQQPFGQPQPGQAPPFGQQAPYGQPAPFGQQGTPFGAPRNYANWGQRALGWLVDFGPAVLIYLVLAIVGVATHWNFIFSLLSFVALVGWIVWCVFNRWIQQGNTGQSMGKRVAKIKLIREDNGQPVGAGMAFLRDLAHFVDNVLCYVGWLWPLWDDKSQTLSDKIVGTVVVQADDAAAAPFGQAGAQQQPFAGGYPPPGQQFGQPSSGGFPQQQPPAPGGFGQPQPPQSGGFEQQPPAPGGFGQPQPGGFGQPSSGGFPQQPQSGGFGQPPQPGGFGQQPGQPLAPPPGGSAFEEGERTQMLRPDAGGGSAFDEQAERTQMLRPEGQDDAGETRKIDPGQFGQPPKDQQ
ncbi:MAG TPA: RDD family protein [Amycolatopsis sp.]|uniref:RDD family protein n=1 Tax=Amycolatopsis sp. TaxID=37632 RepID=UPI002F3F0DCA